MKTRSRYKDLLFEHREIAGNSAFELACALWPINRSLTGPGVRETLGLLAAELPSLAIHEVPTGYQAFDWIVPDEWSLKRATLTDPNGKVILDSNDNNLHVVGYSESVDTEVTLEDLQAHLHSLPDQPEAIPYVTSYYSRTWGLCLSEHQRRSLLPGNYKVLIDSKHYAGVLNYGELFIEGEVKDEILLSTYVCHPSMANNELSGPVVATEIAKWIASEPRHYSYRLVFVPETLGSLVYLSKHLPELQSRVVAGFNISCVGDDRAYSYLPSRDGGTISDAAAKHVLRHIDQKFTKYTWFDRGSDERQYCAPGVDLPIATIMRTSYGKYPEYHTSLDTLGDVVTAAGLAGGFYAIGRALEAIDKNYCPKVATLGEPQLGRRGLYPNTSKKGSADGVKVMMDLISMCDGIHTMLELAELLDVPIWHLHGIIEPLVDEGLIEIESSRS